MKLLIAIILSSIYLFSADAFIQPSDLKNNILANNKLVILDTTDSKTFEKGHIVNAIQVEVSDFRHQEDTYQLMNSPKEIQAIARSLGIDNDSLVVIYGHNKGKELLMSSYIALALVTNGFNNVSILNGGYDDWAFEYEDMVSTETVTPKKGNFVASFNPNILVDKDYVLKRIGTTPMIEARPLQYFNGSAQSQGVKRLGHIPSAHSSFWKDKFNSDETIKSDEQLNAIYLDDNGLNKEKEVIAYCTGGLEASMNWYILHQHLSFKDVKVYDASMREWGNLDDTPMEK